MSVSTLRARFETRPMAAISLSDVSVDDAPSLPPQKKPSASDLHAQPQQRRPSMRPIKTSCAGISVRYLLELSSTHSALDLYHIRDSLVKPQTEHAQCSFVELLQAQTSTAQHVKAEANFYVICPWSLSLGFLLSCLRAHTSAFVYLDVFCLNQHRPSVQSSYSLQSSLDICLATIRSVLLIADSFESPTSNTRSWCLAELLCAYHKKCRVTLLLAELDELALVQQMLDGELGSEDYFHSLPVIDAKKAVCSVDADAQALSGLLRSRDPGLLTDIYATLMREKLVDLARATPVKEGTEAKANVNLVMGGLYEATGKLEVALVHMDKALQAQTKAGTGDLKLGRVLLRKGGVLRKMGRLAEASRVLEQGEQAIRKAGGRTPELAQALNDRARLLKALGRLDEALPLYEEAERISREALGADHPASAQLSNNRASILWAMGKEEEATALGLECLRVFKQTLGDDHPSTLQAKENWGG